MNMYDTSVKVPGIFSMPGTIPAGRVSQAMLSHYDIFGTVLDFAGIPYAPDGKMPGASFADILRGRDSGKSREEVVVFDEYGPVRMIRTRQWKYVARRMPGCDELYDLACDPGEEHNLIDDPAYRPRVAELRARLFDWFAKYSEPRLDGWVEDVRGHGQLDSHSFSKGGLKS
jgi:choline-sulfatase